MTNEILYGFLQTLPLEPQESTTVSVKVCNCMSTGYCPFCSDEEIVQCDLGDTTCEACQ